MRNIEWADYYPLFTPDEFECKCGCGLLNMTKEHMDMLYHARVLAGIPFVVRSGCRCEEHNRKEGGKESSDHLFGCGTDIQAQTGREKWIIDLALVKAGFARIGTGPDFIHAGNYVRNPHRVRWGY